jgi:hypothetical protein
MNLEIQPKNGSHCVLRAGQQKLLLCLSYPGSGHRRISTVRWRSVDRKIKEKRNDMKTYGGREIETEQAEDGKWIACAQDANRVMVVARPGWHYETEEDAIADVEALIDQQL